MRVIEVRGLRKKDIFHYIKTYPGYLEHRTVCESKSTFIGEYWNITVHNCDAIKIGSIRVSRFIIEFEHMSGLESEIIDEFRLNFLSAGG